MDGQHEARPRETGDGEGHDVRPPERHHLPVDGPAHRLGDAAAEAELGWRVRAAAGDRDGGMLSRIRRLTGQPG